MSTLSITIPAHLEPAVAQLCAEHGRTLEDYTLRMILSSVATPVGSEWVLKPKYKPHPSVATFTQPWLESCYETFVKVNQVPTFIPVDGIDIAHRTIRSVQGLPHAVECLAQLHTRNQVKKGIAYTACAHLMRGNLTKYLYDALPVPSTLAAELLVTDDSLTELPASR